MPSRVTRLSILRRHNPEAERRYLVKLVRDTKGNIAAMARLAQVHRDTVYQSLNRYGLRELLDSTRASSEEGRQYAARAYWLVPPQK